MRVSPYESVLRDHSEWPQQRSFREATFLRDLVGQVDPSKSQSGGDILLQMVGLEKYIRILKVNAMEAYLVPSLHRSN